MTRYAKRLFSLILLVILLIGYGIYYLNNTNKIEQVVVNEPIEEQNPTVKDCNTDKSCVSDFTDSNNIFSFKYNSLFKVTEGDGLPTIEWRSGSKNKGVVLANILIPKEYMSGTNFSDARLKIGRSSEPNVIKTCISNSAEKVNGEFVIGGYNFSKFTSNGAGAGNFYETTNYRGIVDGDCYSLEYIIHSTNIGNYSPDQNIKEFDKTKVESELENIIKSFNFNINEKNN